MRYIKLFLGMIKVTIISLLSFNKISFKYPIRFDKGAELSVRIKGKIKLGKHTSIGNNSQLASTKNAIIKVGNYSGIGKNTIVVAREKIQIGNNVLVGPNVCIYDHDHLFKNDGIIRNMGFTTKPIIIEDNVWIGAGCIILKGVTIGSGSVIAAGTLINKNVPPNSIVYNKREVIIANKY